MGTENSYIIDINHPSQVHLFRRFIDVMSRDHRILVTVKNIPVAIKLLKLYGIPFTLLGGYADAMLLKGMNQIKYIASLWNLVRKNKINIGIGTSFTLNHVSKISSLRSFFFDDDDSKVQPFTKKFANPFADYIITPECLKFENYGDKHLTYPGYHELAYLHPNQFKPEPEVLKLAGVRPGDPFFIVRFNVFKAHHDINASGIPSRAKKKLISMLEKHGKVFITNERDSDEEYKKYQINIPEDKIHSLMYYAKMFIGDSQTMTSEAAVLGTPAIRCNSFVGRISYLEELEKKFRLTFGFLPGNMENMFFKINELLKIPDLKDEWKRRRDKMLNKNIDVSSFIIWFFSNYPESTDLLKQDKINWSSFR